MSAAGAIESGRAFVRFFAETKDLTSAMKTLGSEMQSWSKQVSANTSSQVTPALKESSAAAKEFGKNASASAVMAANGLQNVVANTAAATGAIINASASMLQMAATAAPVQRVSTALAGVVLAGAQLFSRLSSMPPILAQISAYMGFVVTKWSNFTSIGRNSLTAAMGMRYMSGILKQLGIDTTNLDRLEGNLRRIGNRAIWAGRGVFLLTAPFKAIYAAANLAITGVTKLARLTSRGVGGSRGSGKIAALSGVTSTLLSGDTPEGESAGTTAAKAVGGGALTGAMIGGIAGAGIGAAAAGIALMVKTAIKKGGEAGASNSKDFLTRLGVGLIAAGQWVSDTFGKFKTAITDAFKSMGGSGTDWIREIRVALFPLVDAVQNVWLPAFSSAITSVVGMFKGGTSEMGDTWAGWALSCVNAIAGLIANFDIYFQIAQQKIVMWAGNGILMIGDFFNGIGDWLTWFGKNWSDVLFNAFDLAATVFINIGQNLRNVFSKIWEWVKSGFTSELNLTADDWKPLTDGYRSTLSEMPKVFKTELAKTTPELDALYDRLEDRQKAMGERAQKINFNSIKIAEEAKKTKGNLSSGAVSGQSQDAYSAIARYQNTIAANPDSATLKSQLAEQKEIKKGINKLADKITPQKGWRFGQ